MSVVPYSQRRHNIRDACPRVTSRVRNVIQPNLLLCTIQLKGSVKEPNTFHNYETEKITRKASDAAENLQLYRVELFGSSPRDRYARRRI